MKQILLAIIAIQISLISLAQDVIVTKEGKKINSKVTEIGENEIKYKNFENLDGPVYTMKKSNISTILYENGQVDVFSIDMGSSPSAPTVTNNTIYYTQTDYINAKKLRNAGVGCFVGGLGLTLTGLIMVGTVVSNGRVSLDRAVVGSFLFCVVGPCVTVAGIVMWPIGQTQMNTIKRLNSNGVSLFANEKVQLNLALGGNNMGLKLHF